MGLMLALAVWLCAPLSAQDAAAERLFREAERLEQTGDPAAALEELELLVRQFPDDRWTPRGWLRIAQLRRERGERQEAWSALERLLTAHARTPQAASALYLQGELALDSAASDQDLSEAQNYFRRVALLFGRDAYPELEARREARIRSAEVALMMEDPASAAAALVAALEDEPVGSGRSRARLALARAWVASGDWQAAAAVLEEAVAEPAAAEDPADADSRAAARRLLSLLHRRVLRPLAGQKPWLTSGRFPATGPELREPSAVAAAPDGRVLVLDSRLPLVLLLDAAGTEMARQTLDDVERPGWTAGGRPFVVASGAVVLPFDGTSFAFTDPGKGAAFKNLVAAAPGAFGDWFVANRGSKWVLHVPGGRTGRELLAEDRPSVADLARDPSGGVYVLDARTPRVFRIRRDGTSRGVVLSGDWKKPAALEVDELGYLYVLDRGHRTVDLFAPDGSRLGRVGPTLDGGIELRNPVDIAIDGAGRLFIADTRLPFVVRLD